MRTIEDLRPHARAALEEAYKTAARRRRCSREDFMSGWLAALEWLGSEDCFFERTAAAVGEVES